MIDQETSDCMLSYFIQLLEFYRKFLDFEKEKLGFLEQDRLDQLDECIKREQVFVLKARGLEQERAELMLKISQPQARFRELIPLFPSGSQEQMRDLYEKLSSVLTDFQETSRKSNLLLEQKLHQSSAVLNQLKGRPELQKMYGEKLHSSSSPAFFSKKI